MNKKIYIIGVIIIALLIGIFGYFAIFKQPRSATPPQTTEISEISTLTVVNSNVQMKAPAAAEFSDVLAQTTQASEGAEVKTSLTGRAIIESANKNILAVDKNSHITITMQKQYKTAIGLTLGNIWATVQKVFGQGEYYQVQTPSAVVTVRGTSFGVLYNGVSTMVMVTQGTVWLLSIDPLTKKPIGQEVAVNEQFKGVVENGQAPVVSAISAADKKSDWYLANNPTAPKSGLPTPAPAQTPPATPTAPADLAPSNPKR